MKRIVLQIEIDLENKEPHLYIHSIMNKKELMEFLEAFIIESKQQNDFKIVEIQEP